jgi:hypothetical protein
MVSFPHESRQTGDIWSLELTCTVAGQTTLDAGLIQFVLT